MEKFRPFGGSGREDDCSCDRLAQDVSFLVESEDGDEDERYRRGLLMPAPAMEAGARRMEMDLTPSMVALSLTVVGFVEMRDLLPGCVMKRAKIAKFISRAAGGRGLSVARCQADGRVAANFRHFSTQQLSFTTSLFAFAPK